MTGDNNKFVDLQLRHGCYVTYGGNNRGRILSRGTLGDHNTFLVKEVLYVEGLKLNLLSISQVYDKNYLVTFKSNCCMIIMPNSQNVKMVGKRFINVYLLDISHSASNINCLLNKHEESWLWHRRITHIYMHHLKKKLISRNLVDGLPRIKFEKDHISEACQKGKTS